LTLDGGFMRPEVYHRHWWKRYKSDREWLF
jgi:hypothetical protein